MAADGETEVPIDSDLARGNSKRSADRAVAPSQKVNLSPRVVLSLKLCIAMPCYFAIVFCIAWLLQHVVTFNRICDRSFSIDEISDDLKLSIALKSCILDVILVDGGGMSFKETSVSDGSAGCSEFNIHTTSEKGKRAFVCRGPSSVHGEAATAVVEVGRDAVWKSTSVVMEPGGRSMLRSDPKVSFGNELFINGFAGIVQIYEAVIPNFRVRLDSGFIFLYQTSFDRAKLTLGAKVPVYMKFAQEQDGIQVDITTGRGIQNASNEVGFCLSDVSARPSLQRSNETGVGVSFSLGRNFSRKRHLSVVRWSEESRIFLAFGVSRFERNCNNTLDTNPQPRQNRLEADFGNWINHTAQSGYELIRLRLFGPSLGADLQSIQSRGSWVYSYYGDALMWFPVSVFYMFTLGMFAPRTARRVALVEDDFCLSDTDILTAGTEHCDPWDSLASDLRTKSLEKSAQAIKASLPASLTLSKAPNSVIYFVDDVEQQGKNRIFTSLADGDIDLISSLRGEYIKRVTGKEAFQGVMSTFFVIVLILMPFVGGAFASSISIALYRVEKRRYLSARLAQLPAVSSTTAWSSEEQPPSDGLTSEDARTLREELDAEARCNLLLTLLQALILRSPSCERCQTVEEVLQVCLGQLLVQGLLVAPICAAAFCINHNLAEVRAVCSFNDWVRGHCGRDASMLSGSLLGIAMAMQIMIFIDTILEYLCRYGMDVKNLNGQVRHRFTRIFALRSSMIYRNIADYSFYLLFFIACGYVILVVLFILLGTLLQPARLAPVLASVGGALVVVQQVTARFNQIFDQAKSLVKNMLDKTHEFAEEVRQARTGDLTSVVTSREKNIVHPISGSRYIIADAKDKTEDTLNNLEAIEEIVMIILGLSRAQLVLLNVEAVFLFLGLTSFLLAGAYLFLGGSALIPQLSANAAALATSIAVIRAKASSFHDQEFGIAGGAFKKASSILLSQGSSEEVKKTQ